MRCRIPLCTETIKPQIIGKVENQASYSENIYTFTVLNLSDQKLMTLNDTYFIWKVDLPNLW
jgi:hypothetical protein